MKYTAIATCVMTLAISFAVYASETRTGVAEKQTERPSDGYVPGMGEIMGATQMRHSKLWFAGKAKNWELASYELDEINEGLEDAVKYHPEGVPDFV